MKIIIIFQLIWKNKCLSSVNVMQCKQFHSNLKSDIMTLHFAFDGDKHLGLCLLFNKLSHRMDTMNMLFTTIRIFPLASGAIYQSRLVWRYRIYRCRHSLNIMELGGTQLVMPKVLKKIHRPLLWGVTCTVVLFSPCIITQEEAWMY